MEQLILNKFDQIGVDFIGIFNDLFSGKFFVSIEIFHDLTFVSFYCVIFNGSSFLHGQLWNNSYCYLLIFV